MVKKATKPLSYEHAALEQRNNIPRSYSYSVLDFILCTQEAQIAYERIERGGIKVISDVMVGSPEDSEVVLSHIGGTCFLLEERWPDVFMRWFRNLDRAENLHESMEAVLDRTEKYLEQENVRITKLLEDNYIRGEPPRVNHKRAYQATCASYAHQRLLNMVVFLDEILLKMDQLKFAGVFKPLQRKEAGYLIMRNVLRAATRLVDLENRVSAEMRQRREERQKKKAEQSAAAKKDASSKQNSNAKADVVPIEGDDQAAEAIDEMTRMKEASRNSELDQLEKEADGEG